MELGIDARQIEGAKALLRKVVGDPVLLRFLVCVLLLVLGWSAVLAPQGSSLAAARKGLRKAENRARMAEELRFFESEKKRFEPHFFADADIVEWQRYVLRKLELSGARLRSLEPKKTVAKGNFKVLELALDATGTYAQLADFVDRVEKGERVVRFSRLRLERRKETIVLEGVLDGLVRAGGKDSGEGGAPAGGRRPQEGERPAGDEALVAGGAPDGASGPNDAAGHARGASAGPPRALAKERAAGDPAPEGGDPGAHDAGTAADAPEDVPPAAEDAP